MVLVTSLGGAGASNSGRLDANMASDEGTKTVSAPASAPETPATTDSGASKAARDDTFEGSAGTEEPGLRERFNAARPPASTGSPEVSEREAFQIRCLRNVRYHEDRERFFARWHKMTMFIVVCAGAASFAQIEKSFLAVSCVVTISALIDLVFDVSGKSRLHSSLRRRIYEILALAENDGSSLSKLNEQLIGIYADEPPCMHAANAMAYNEAMAAFQRPREFHFKLSWWQRRMRNIFAFAGTRFQTFSELHEHPTGI
jgi:hypothetical protein